MPFSTQVGDRKNTQIINPQVFWQPGLSVSLS
jgi:hypothetical protein